MIKSLSGRIYFGAALAFLTVPVIILLYFDAFQRHDDLLRAVRQTEAVVDQAADLQQALTELSTARSAAPENSPAAKSAADARNLLTVDRTLSKLADLLTDEPAQLSQLDLIERTTSDLLSGKAGRLPDLRHQLTALKRQARQTLTLREQASARTDYWEKCGMWGAVFVAISNIGILIASIFEEFRKRRRAERELKSNLKTLQNYNEESNEHNWQLTGVSAISQSLQGKMSPQKMAHSALTALLQYLDLPTGAIYLYDPATERLVLTTAVGLAGDVDSSYGLNEGLIGQAAMAYQPVLINDVPANYWRIQSGSGQGQPGQLVLVPLWYRYERIGVVELGAFRELETPCLNLLKRVMEPLAVALNSAQTHEQVVSLLEQVQQQNELVANQQEELRQSNDALVRQAESLQASEEELKVQEEELRQINAELIEKNEAVEIARQALALKARELEVTSQYKSAFLANMSHELRTPLNSVLILAKLLADNKPDTLTAKQVEYANVIHKSGTDLLTLINDILDLAKIEAGHIELHTEAVSVKSIVRDMTQLFGVLAEEKGVQLRTTIADSVPTDITTDKLRLEQIIKNLLSNAFKFTPRTGAVTLSFGLTNDVSTLTRASLRNEALVLAIAVSDTGIGIPTDKQQLIFEAFQQVDGSTSRKYGGTGLGLSISRELIKRLGGEITLHSEEGQGSTFTIYLPLSASVPATLPASANLPAQKQMPGAATPAERPQIPDDRDTVRKGDNVMLIVEDDTRFAQIVQDFARSKGYKTIVALQGDEGLRCARQYSPSAIILDLQLPVLDGASLLKLLKDDETLRHIPVHIMSAGDEPGLGLPGALAYLKKPVEKADLEAAFTRISSRLAERVRNVLVLSGDHLTDNSLARLIDERHFDVTCEYGPLDDWALERVRRQTYDCIIADIGKDVEKGTEKLRQLQLALQSDAIPVIIYLDTDLSDLDQLQLKRVSDTIIRDSVQSKNRLMDELELFLYKVQTDSGKSFVSADTNDIPATASTNWRGRTVLLVDDDMRNVFSLSTLLEEYNLTVLTASDGQEALDVVNQQASLDLVLMDIMMPTMDGYEATRRIRTDERFTQLPIIALTAKAMPGDREKCLEAGASDYITKPVDINQLLSVMHVWMQPQ